MAVVAANGNASTSGFLLHNQNAPSSAPPDALFLSPSYSSFIGSRSRVILPDMQGGKAGGDTDGSLFRPFVHDVEIGEDDMEEYVHQPEKKRRLSADQVQFLQKSFEIENKLEPERKIQLARDLGLQPRQVAIWFQNRRARWKTKQLEKEFESLETSYTNLKANYENLLKEKDRLKAEVASLTEKVRQKEEQEITESKKLPKWLVDSACEEEGMVSSAKSDILDSESPHYTDGVHSSSVVEHCDSSHAFEADQSDLSQDEEDNLSLSNSIFSPCIFPKLEYADDEEYWDPPESSCHFGFTEEDHTFWSWSY